MARRHSAEREQTRRDWGSLIRYVSVSVGTVLLAVMGVFVYYKVDRYLASSPRFLFAGPAGYGEENSALRIEGIVHASRARVVKTFTEDFGRSLYLIPLAERRRSLLAIDWIKHASLSRLWPDQLVVRIEERTPVAFVRLPVSGRSGPFRMALIDGEGVLLDPPERADFRLHVLTGIRREQSREMRRQRVWSAMRLVEELGDLANDLSEIDVMDPENLKVTQQLGGRAVVLVLGNQNFQSRLRTFLDHYPEIYRRLAHATTFDLRLDDRITAVGEAGDGG